MFKTWLISLSTFLQISSNFPEREFSLNKFSSFNHFLYVDHINLLLLIFHILSVNTRFTIWSHFRVVWTMNSNPIWDWKDGYNRAIHWKGNCSLRSYAMSSRTCSLFCLVLQSRILQTLLCQLVTQLAEYPSSWWNFCWRQDSLFSCLINKTYLNKGSIKIASIRLVFPRYY